MIDVNTVTILEPSGRMLRIKENLPQGYYIRTNDDGIDHTYYIQTNKHNVKILNYVNPTNNVLRKKSIGNIVVNYSYDVDKDTAIANHDGVFKQISGYRSNEIIFNDDFKGFYLAYQEKNKSGLGIVFKDIINYGSKLRIIVSDEQVYPRQIQLFNGKVVSAHGLQGVYHERHKEFDISGQRGVPQHLLIRVEFLRKTKPADMPHPFLYQRIIEVKPNRKIVYTVVPIIHNGKRVGIADMFPINPLR
jgi:hypothetical protein